MDQYSAIIWGSGVVGSQIVRVLSRKKSVRIVGGIVHSPDKAGRDIGTISGLPYEMGLTVSTEPKEVLKNSAAEVVLLVTQASRFYQGTFDKNVEQIIMSLNSGKNVITTTGFLYPWRLIPEIAEQIDQTARKNNVTFFGTGLNPGFLSDILLMFLTAPLVRVDRIKIRDMEDMTLYNSVPIMRDMLGYGLTPDEFQEKIAARFEAYMKDLYSECIHFLADSLGVEGLEIRSRLQSYTTSKKVKTVCMKIEPGTIVSQVFVLEGLKDGEPFITIEYGAKPCPDIVEEGGPLGQTIEIDGSPSVSFDLKGDLVERGILSTAGHVINAVPHVVASSPGIVTRRDLPPFVPIP